MLTGFDQTYDEGTGPAQAHLAGLSAPTRSVPIRTLTSLRAERLAEEPELLVKDAVPGLSRVASVLGRDYSGQELALGAVGLYAAYSVLARA